MLLDQHIHALVDKWKNLENDIKVIGQAFKELKRSKISESKKEKN
jgi:hypothetical protein